MAAAASEDEPAVLPKVGGTAEEVVVPVKEGGSLCLLFTPMGVLGTAVAAGGGAVSGSSASSESPGSRALISSVEPTIADLRMGLPAESIPNQARMRMLGCWRAMQRASASVSVGGTTSFPDSEALLVMFQERRWIAPMIGRDWTRTLARRCITSIPTNLLNVIHITTLLTLMVVPATVKLDGI